MRIRTRSVLCALSLVLTLTAGLSAQSLFQRGALPGLDQDISAEMLLSDWSVQEFDLPGEPGEPFTLSVDLGGQVHGLVLVPHSVRSDDYQVLVQQADGSYVEHAPSMPSTYRGIVSGVADSVVAASLVDGQLTATIVIAKDQPVWGIQPADKVASLAPSNLHVVYSGLDILATDATCGTSDISVRPATPLAPAGDGGSGDVVCEIACDADVEFYNLNGSSVSNTENDINAIINATEAIYESDVGILYQVTTIIVRTSEPDPYSTTSPSSLLSQFRNYWNANHAGVQRDVAHLFTGKNIDSSVIGIASLSVICNKSSAYGLSQSRYTSNFTNRTALTAHELGHNWSASHCDGASDCKIMCSGLGGCTGGVTSFGSGSINSINNKKNAVGCLDDAVPPPPPVISSISPANVEAFEGGTVSVAGSGFAKANGFWSGGIQLHKGTGYTIVNDGLIQYDAPAPLALGQAIVTVSNKGG
ncbi:MAG: M12 family metallo-peptidase, partial [Planctomycetota bacterium]